MKQVKLLELEQHESVRLDSRRLEDLYLQLGQNGAETVVCRALEELAARLAHTDRCFRAGRFEDMRKSARSLVAIADQVGMQMLARVAGHVTLCIDEGDPVALSATLARLLRIGERSLTEIWDMQNLSV